jgi:hypothetical protein
MNANTTTDLNTITIYGIEVEVTVEKRSADRWTKEAKLSNRIALADYYLTDEQKNTLYGAEPEFWDAEAKDTAKAWKTWNRNRRAVAKNIIQIVATMNEVELPDLKSDPEDNTGFIFTDGSKGDTYYVRINRVGYEAERKAAEVARTEGRAAALEVAKVRFAKMVEEFEVKSATFKVDGFTFGFEVNYSGEQVERRA